LVTEVGEGCSSCKKTSTGRRRPPSWSSAPPDPKATTSAARADKTTRRHGRASQGRAAGAGSGRRPIGNGGGGHGDLLEDGEAAPQTTAEHTTDFRQSTISPAARFPIGVPDPQQLPLGVTCPPHQASAAEAGLVHLCVWWKAVREDALRCWYWRWHRGRTGRAAGARGGLASGLRRLPWYRRRPGPPRWPDERLEADPTSNRRVLAVLTFLRSPVA
jgi:hypothetical protein